MSKLDSNSFKNLLYQISPFAEAEWSEFEGFFTDKSIKKHAFLWQQGDICKHLVFVKYGSFRSYHETEIKEVTDYFFFENTFFTDDHSFGTQLPCYNYYQAMEDSLITLVPRSALHLLFEKYHSFERLGRIIVEQRHMATLEYHQRQKFLSADKRYRTLIQEEPHILSRVSLKHIASYLGISPEHLSRIRSSEIDNC